MVVSAQFTLYVLFFFKKTKFQLIVEIYKANKKKLVNVNVPTIKKNTTKKFLRS